MGPTHYRFTKSQIALFLHITWLLSMVFSTIQCMQNCTTHEYIVEDQRMNEINDGIRRQFFATKAAKY